ncbi:MAG: hypothetical protein EOM52_06030 [Clostridia bacterium]|nr:hypothetical protein [Clostridia bacterium]
MEISLTGQLAVFLGAAVLGIGGGLLYDLFRLLCRRVRIPLLGSLLDLLFWLAVTAGLFLFVITAGAGEMRIFMLLAVFLGAVVYFLALSGPALFLAGLVADGIAFLWKILTYPVRLLWFLGKKTLQIAKNHFHYWRKWYKIRLIPEEMETLTHPERGGKGGKRHGKDEKGGISDQTGHPGSAHLHGHVAFEPTGPAADGTNAAGDPEHPGGGAETGKRRPGRRRGKQRRP